MSDMTVQWEELTSQPGTLVVRVIGDAGVVNAEALGLELARLVTRRPKLAVLDLSGVMFVSSLGMGALISFQRSLGRHGGAARLAWVPPLVADALRRAQLEKLLPMYATVDEALAAGDAAAKA